MSLDIYAHLPQGEIVEYENIDGSYRRWEREDRKKHCTEKTDLVFSWNITHNLGAMAHNVPISDTFTTPEKNNLYYLLWRPEEVFTEPITLKTLRPYLELGLTYLLQHEEELSQYNPENGWGHYENFVNLLPNYIRACYKWPDAIVTVSR